MENIRANIQTGALPALGRLLMAFIFITSGYGKLMAPAGTIAYFGSHGLPSPEIAYAISVAVELGGGLLLLAGLFTRWVAAVLGLFCLATAFLVHDQPGDMDQMIHFMKNICMAGGFLQVVAFGAGAWSIDAVRRRVAGPARAVA